MDETNAKEDGLIALKKELKTWEAKFKKRNGRPPTRDDIRSENMDEKYRLYNSLKGGQSHNNCSALPTENPPKENVNNPIVRISYIASPSKSTDINHRARECAKGSVPDAHLKKKSTTPLKSPEVIDKTPGRKTVRTLFTGTLGNEAARADEKKDLRSRPIAKGSTADPPAKDFFNLQFFRNLSNLTEIVKSGDSELTDTQEDELEDDNPFHSVTDARALSPSKIKKKTGPSKFNRYQDTEVVADTKPADSLNYLRKLAKTLMSPALKKEAAKNAAPDVSFGKDAKSDEELDKGMIGGEDYDDENPFHAVTEARPLSPSKIRKKSGPSSFDRQLGIPGLDFVIRKNKTKRTMDEDNFPVVRANKTLSLKRPLSMVDPEAAATNVDDDVQGPTTDNAKDTEEMDSVNDPVHAEGDMEEDQNSGDDYESHPKRKFRDSYKRQTKAHIPAMTAANVMAKKKKKKVTEEYSGMLSSNFRRLNLRSKKGGKKAFGGGGNWKARRAYTSSGSKNSSREPGDENVEGLLFMDEGIHDDMDCELEENGEDRSSVIAHEEWIVDEHTMNAITLSEIYLPKQLGPSVYVDLVGVLRKLTGFDKFREGQENVIARVLMGKSTLMVYPTGAGKSLCYQLPAYVLSHLPSSRPHLTLVITPTISLMEDQTKNLPSQLKGACWHSGTEASDVSKILQSIRNGSLQVLFISPEKLVHVSRTFEKYREEDNGTFPLLKFACVDEVHCVSEWSHNFRPSYLHVQSHLRRLGVQCILGLTGTATSSLQKSLCQSFGMNHEEDVIVGNLIRPNLMMTISRDEDRKKAIVRLLKTPRFRSLNSILVYCARQSDADELARHLSNNNIEAESYHAGKAADQRMHTQQKFLSGQLRVLCATIAFGLGVHKSDIRAVLHYGLPRSLEGYVQEIGRSGRDGLPSYCHLFLTPTEYYRHRSLLYSDYVDESTVRNLLLKIFRRRYSEMDLVRMKQSAMPSDSHQNRTVALEIAKLEKELDVRRTALATLLGYIEGEGAIKVLPCIYISATARFYKISVEELKGTYPWLHAMLKVAQRRADGGYTFKCMDLCREAGCSYGEWIQIVRKMQGRREMYMRFSDEAFHLEIVQECFDAHDVAIAKEDSFGSDTYSDCDELGKRPLRRSEQKSRKRRRNDVAESVACADLMRVKLMSKVMEVENLNLKRINWVYSLLNLSSTNSYDDIYSDFRQTGSESVGESNQDDEQRNRLSEILHQGILGYFNAEEMSLEQEEIIEQVTMAKWRQDRTVVEQDIRSFVTQNATDIRSGLAVARIFHGISSPQCTFAAWCHNEMWGKYVEFDFRELLKIANRVILEERMKQIETLT